MNPQELHELEGQYETAKSALRQVYEQLKKMFAAFGEEFKATPVEAEVVEPVKPAETPAPADAPKPADEAKPAEPQPANCPDLSALQAKLDKLAETDAAILSLLESHDLTLKELQENQASKIKAVEEQNDEKQERLEHIIQTVQEDRYRKDKLKLIKRSIFQADMIRKTIYEYPEITKEMDAAAKEAFLLKQLESIVVGIESMLADEGAVVTRFSPVGEKVDTEHQEVVGVKETTEEAKNGTVAESVSPGYVWTLPYILKAKLNESGEEVKSYKFLMQTEQVIAYKFVKQ